MTNIPTELLRTLVAVVELRSFTKAAQSMGVSQPAVSAQIKRLQHLLGSELLDKSAPGVTLTEKGQTVINYARRLLAINDQILDLALQRPSAEPLRIGIPGDFGGTLLPAVLAQFRAHAPRRRFHMRSEGSDHLLRGLQQGTIDLVVAFSQSDSMPDSRHRWTEKVMWIRGPATVYDPADPVPLVMREERCLIDRLATRTLDQAGRRWEVVLDAPNSTSIAAAVAAGLGIHAAIARHLPPNLTGWNDAPLPPLPSIDCGIYLRDGPDHHLLELLADAIADAIRPSDDASARPSPSAAGPMTAQHGA